jgi:hypothetical protein
MFINRGAAALAAACTIAVLPASASAAGKDRSDCSRSLERTYTERYKEVRQRHGRRAPGRNIRDNGVVRRNQTVRDARCSEIRRSIRQLKVLLTVPKPYTSVPTATVVAAPPAQMPSGVESPVVTSTGGSSNSMVNPDCESSGNPQVVDPSGTYWGKYQFDRQTWAAHGGNPSSYGSASEVEQDRIAAAVTYDAWPNC